MSKLLCCPLCRKPCTSIDFTRSHRGPYEIYVAAFHGNTGADSCRGYMTPTNAAAAMTAKATRYSMPYPRIQPTPRSGT